MTRKRKAMPDPGPGPELARADRMERLAAFARDVLGHEFADLARREVHHRRHLPERVLLAGLHAHPAVLTQEGCQPNPYQLPDAIAALQQRRTRDDQ